MGMKRGKIYRIKTKESLIDLIGYKDKENKYFYEGTLVSEDDIFINFKIEINLGHSVDLWINKFQIISMIEKVD